MCYRVGGHELYHFTKGSCSSEMYTLLFHLLFYMFIDNLGVQHHSSEYFTDAIQVGQQSGVKKNLNKNIHYRPQVGDNFRSSSVKEASMRRTVSLGQKYISWMQHWTEGKILEMEKLSRIVLLLQTIINKNILYAVFNTDASGLPSYRSV